MAYGLVPFGGYGYGYGLGGYGGYGGGFNMGSLLLYGIIAAIAITALNSWFNDGDSDDYGEPSHYPATTSSTTHAHQWSCSYLDDCQSLSQ